MTRFRLVIVIIILVVGLIIRFWFFEKNQVGYKNGQQLSLVTRITEEPQEKFGHQQFRVRVGNGERITIITGLMPVLQYGDRVKLIGKINKKDYNGLVFTSLKTEELQIDNTEQNFITGSATYIRRKATNIFKNNLSPVSASLLTGIVFGGNQGMPDKFLQQLRNSGVIHVIAASGMNVTFVAGALIGVLGLLFKRKIALTIAIFGIIFYAFLAGFEASIIRATIMAILAFSARLFGRQNFSLLAIFLTGYTMLFISPSLIPDAGFQLSFLATAGILVIKPLLDGGLERLGSVGKIVGQDFTTTVAAQAATLPIVLGVFGSLGILSVLVNVLVLWTVPILMIFGSFALIFGMIWEPLGRIFLFLSEPILFFFEKTVAYFGNLGWTINLPSVSPAVWIGYYLLLGGLILFVKKRSSKEGEIGTWK